MKKPFRPPAPPRLPAPSPDGQTILYGRLKGRRPRDRGRHLLIEVLCPYCQKRVTHGWSLASKSLDETYHKSAHCKFGAPYGAGYWVALDPQFDHESLRLLQRYAMAPLERRPPPAVRTRRAVARAGNEQQTAGAGYSVPTATAAALAVPSNEGLVEGADPLNPVGPPAGDRAATSPG